VLVPEQVQHAVHERPPPLVADDLRADGDVAERARDPLGQRLAAVEREREDVGRLVDPEVVALQLAALLRPDECEADLAVLDPLRCETRRTSSTAPASSTSTPLRFSTSTETI
jgi:hypothetical protein